MAGPFDDLIPGGKSVPGAPMTVVVGPADPSRTVGARRTQQQIDQDEATEADRRRKAKAEADKAVADAEEARRTLSSGDTPDPALAAAIKGLGIDELLASVNEARREIGTGRATGIVGALGRIIPGSSANDFAGSLNSIQGAVIMEKLQQLKDASKTGASGMGALSEREGARLADSIAALGTKMSDEKLLRSLATVERHARALQAVGAGKNPDDPAVAKEFGIVADEPTDPKKAASAAPNGPGAGDPLTLSKDGTETVIDPALSGANQHIAAMIKAGRSEADVKEYLETVRPGLSGEVRNIGAWVKFHALHPDRPINVMIDRTERPLTPAGSLLNTAAQSPAGAFVMGAGDFVSGGTLDNMTGNSALARAGMRGVAAEHPYATLAGQVGGGALAGFGVEAGLARAGAGGLASVLGGDALPAMGYGAGSSDDGGRLGGAALGGLSGLIGGAVGRGVGRAVSGAADPAVQFLADRGVRMTPGQLIGGVPKRIEDGLTSIPLLGDIIRNQRTRGIEDFNRAAFGEALEPIGQVAGEQIGEAGVGNAENLIGQAYQTALGGRRVTIDPQFGADLGGAVNATRAVPRVGEEVADSIGEIVPPYFNQAGELNGENMQPLLRELREFRSGYRADPLGSRIGARVRDVEGAVTGMFERQAPDVMPAFNSANDAFSRFSVVRDAVKAGKNTNGRFMPSQLTNAAVANAERYGGKASAISEDRNFFDLSRNAQNVLPSTLPDSGTASRIMLPGALGLAGAGVGGYGGSDSVSGAVEGAGTGFGTGAAMGTALMSPYLMRPRLQRLLTARRPEWLRPVGNVIGASRLPGALALPLLAEGQ